MTKRDTRLGDVATVVAGGTPTRGIDKYYGGSIPWVKTLDLNCSTVLNTEELITAEGLRSIRGGVNPVGTVMVAMYGGAGTIGKTGILGVPAATNQAVASVLPNPKRFDPAFLHYQLVFLRDDWMRFSQGNRKDPNINKSVVEDMSIWLPDCVAYQQEMAARLAAELHEIDRARVAAVSQLSELIKLADSLIFESIAHTPAHQHRLGDVLEEVKQGVGAIWSKYPVLGATRNGLAPAREQPGKHAVKYKPVLAGTVFYNPMRILIGSIAFVDDGDEPGITSPDYVVLRGKSGSLDSRWFYYWLRSPLGRDCINSLARGAVRERMLFNRLAEGEIYLPSPSAQRKTSEMLRELRGMQFALCKTIHGIEALPQKMLGRCFSK